MKNTHIMTIYEQDDIALVKFPFTDLTTAEQIIPNTRP